MPIPLPPYALATPSFRFRALAAQAGRAPLGGEREIALAAYMSARLADDARAELGIPDQARITRATAARSWLAALALPTSLRNPFARLVDATGGDPEVVRRELRTVISALEEHLDPAALAELEQLSQALTR